MRKWTTLFLTVLGALLGLAAWQAAAQPGKRVALVIGNGDYANAGVLANPVNDAADMAAMLESLGFTVFSGSNLGKRALEGKIGEFSDALDGASAGLFFYAGHGLQVDGRNFIVPVDARLDMPAKLRLEAVPMDDIIDIMESQTPVSLVFLDACRNNPFARSLSRAAKTRSAAAVGEGLAQFSASRGSFIAFSTAPGAVAMDGTGRNSPFTAALLRHIDAPGTGISDMMIAVRRDVLKETRDFQTPWEQGSLTERFEFAPGGAAPQAAAVMPLAAEAPEGAEAEIRQLITDLYLKPEPERFAESLPRVFAPTAVLFGQAMDLPSIIAAKQAWFGQWRKWDFEQGPVTVTLKPGGKADAEFSLNYRYWPLDESKPPVGGKVTASLGFERTPDGWRVAREDAR